MDSPIVYKTTIIGSSNISSNIEGKMFFATKTSSFQPSTIAYILPLPLCLGDSHAPVQREKPPVEVNVKEKYVVGENTEELCKTLR